MKSGTRAAHGVCHGVYGLVLAYHTLVQLILEMEQLLPLALHHPRDRYASPSAHHLGYVVGGHFLSHQSVATLRGMKLQLHGVDVVLQAFQLAIANLSHFGIVAFTLSLLRLKLQALNGLLVLLNLVHQSFLGFPLSPVRVLLFFQFGNFLVELLYLVVITLALDGLTLNLKLLEFTRNLVELFRLRVTFHAQLGGSLVHQVDGLVGEVTVGDVSL